MLFMTTHLSVQSESAMLMSIYKPILVVAVMTGWAWVVSYLEKDGRNLFLKWRIWNMIQISGGALAFFIWLFAVPFFWVGLLLALIIFTGTIGGYAIYRNDKVSEHLRWRLSLDSFTQKFGEIQHTQAQKRAAVRLLTKDGADIVVPSGEDPNAQAHVILEQLIDFALPREANRLEMLADANKATLGVRVDGVTYPQPEIEPRLAITLIDYIKQHAGMDTDDRRRKQRGVLLVDAGEYGRHELSVAYAGSTRGLNMIVDIDREKATLMSLEPMGLLESQRQKLEPLLDESGYAIIVTCPPHQGLSTTLNSLVNRHDPYTQSVMTLEQEIEIELEGVTHDRIEPGSDGETIERRLAAILRLDPTVVMLGIPIDPARARLVIEAAKEVRFYFGIQSDDTFSALNIWLKTIGNNQLAGQGIGAIISQRLVRKLCSTCRIAYKPDPAVLKKLNLPPERVPQLYKSSGKIRVGKDRTDTCPQCFGMGYRGRVGVFETMVLDNTARKILGSGQIDQFRSHLRRGKMLYLQESALLKVVEGMTSISEINRVLKK